jgi:hypothetical protein
MKSPRESRTSRIKPSGNSWTLASVDLASLIRDELKNSSERNHPKFKNRIPIYTIPIIVSFIRAIAIEIENQRERYGEAGYKSQLLKQFEKNEPNEIGYICRFYRMEKGIKKSALLLNEIRHEIIHPAPYREKGQILPEYLVKLEKTKVLWRPPVFGMVSTILDLFCSHELLKWSVNVMIKISNEIIKSDKYRANQDIFFEPIFKEMKVYL